MNFKYYMPTKIFFGRGELQKLKTETLPGKKALIVISNGTSMKRLGYLDNVISLLKENNCESVVFSEVQPNPTDQNVADGAKMAKEHNCDFIVGLGGGSSIDCAKSISIMATNPGEYWDYIGGGSGKQQQPTALPLPLIAITTTAGTGTEADPWTVITKSATGEKIGYGYDATFPVFSIVDPDLMMSVPPKLTAYQGFDALFHATEGYIANISNVMSDMYALKSIELIGHNLPLVINDGDNETARENMALANTLSGFVESTSSCTSCHSIEHALSGYHPDLPHGAGLIMLSESYYRKFLDVCPERFIDMAKALGKKDATSPNDFIDALLALQHSCHVDDLVLSDFSIDKEKAKMYATHAFDIMGGLFGYDRIKLSIDDVIDIIKKTY